MLQRTLCARFPLLSLLLALVVPTLAPPALGAQGERVTLEQIMAHPDWIGNAPENPVWGDRGEAVYFTQKRRGEEISDLYRVELDGTPEAVQVPDERRGEASVAGGDWSRDRTAKVYVREGDIYLRDVETGAVTQLTRTAARESSPRFLADESRVVFERGDALFVRDLEAGLESQVADLRFSEDPAEKEEKAEESQGYLGEQQERLFEIIRKTEGDRIAERERDRELQAADPLRPPLPWYFGEDRELAFQTLSPSGRYLLVATQPAERDQGKADSMPRWVTESGYIENEEVRPKVGTGDGQGYDFALLDLEERERHDLAPASLPGITDDPLRELREAARARREAAAASDDGEDEAGEGGAGDGEDETQDEGENGDDEPEARELRILGLAWNDGGPDRLALMLASVDNKDRWIATVDLEAGELVPRHRLTDPAWIGWDFNEMGWVGSDLLWYLSEESRYSHLYTLDVAAASPTPRQLTGGSGAPNGGAFVVGDVELSPDERSFYFEANPEHPGVYEVYRVPVAGGAMEQVTNLGGLLEFELSPAGDRLLLSASSALVPPELYLASAAPVGEGEPARRLTHTVSEEFTSIPWVAPEYVAVPSSHTEQPIHSRLYLPPGYDAARAERYPAVLFVHGAGYLQNAHKGWSNYFREFMFHTLLAQHGYVVLDMDYRASAGYGRDWRTAIYRQMGTPELEDLEDGVDWLVAERHVDPDRVGVYGGSYGGFMTFMALFKRPGLFAAGAALRPVTDWAHYNHGYTSNILNTPEVDPEAYERSSPIELADGLSDPLLIIHGMLDDNVFFEDTVRLVQRLIELEKEDWEVAIYPVEPHGFVQPSSWLDAYRRIFELFEENVKPTGDGSAGAADAMGR